jgi:hypothetical protein
LASIEDVRNYQPLEQWDHREAGVGRRMPGYFFYTGNYLTGCLSPKGVKAYLDAAEKYGVRST